MRTSQRIALCRLGVVLFALLPTVVIACFVAGRSLLGSTAAGSAEWQRELARELGCEVQIARVHYPHRSAATLHEVRFAGAGGLRQFANSPEFTIATAPGGWRAEAAQCEVESAQFSELLRILKESALRSLASEPTPPSQEFALTIRSVVVRGQPRGETLRNVHLRVLRSASASSAELDFEFGSSTGAATPVKLVATRRSGEPAGGITWHLDAGGTALPVHLLEPLWPAAAHLGPDCRVSGKADLSEAGAISGECQLRLESIDLDTLISEQFPHHLSGLATLQIDKARLAAGKLVEATGEVRADDGSIGVSLLAAAQEHLGLQSLQEINQSSPAAALPYKRLACRFAIDDEALRVSSAPSQAGDAIVIAADQSPLLTCPARHQVTAIALVRALVPGSQFQVPATRQTAALVRLLPVPSIVPGGPATAGHTPTRLSPTPPASQSAIRQPVLR